MQRGESVVSDPRKALSRCLGQEEAGQAGTAVTLKLAQPPAPAPGGHCLHMPASAPTPCSGILASPAWSSWGSGHCSPQPLNPHWSVFSFLLSEPDLSFGKDALCCYGVPSSGMKADSTGTKLSAG